MANSLSSANVHASDTEPVNKIDSIITLARAAGKLPPALEEVWRGIGEKDLAALEALAANAPRNAALSTPIFDPEFGVNICYAADRSIDSFLNPIILKMTASRAAIAAFKEAAVSRDPDSKLHWPSLMDALDEVMPSDEDMAAAVTKIRAVVEVAVEQALSGADSASVLLGGKELKSGHALPR